MTCHLNEQGLVKIKDVLAKMNSHRVVENTSLSVILQECEKRDVDGKILGELLSVSKNIVKTSVDTPAFFTETMLETTLSVIQFYDESCEKVFISDACDYLWTVAALMFKKTLVESFYDADLVVWSTETEKNLWQGDDPSYTRSKKTQKVHWDITHGGIYDYLQDQKHLEWDSASVWMGQLVCPDLTLQVVMGTTHDSLFDGLEYVPIAKCYFGLLHLGVNGILSMFMSRCRIAHHMEIRLGPEFIIQAVQDPRGFLFENPFPEPVPTATLTVKSTGPIVSVFGATPYCRMERWKKSRDPLMETMEAISIAVPFSCQDENKWVQEISQELIYNLNHGLFHSTLQKMNH